MSLEAGRVEAFERWVETTKGEIDEAAENSQGNDARAKLEGLEKRVVKEASSRRKSPDTKAIQDTGGRYQDALKIAWGSCSRCARFALKTEEKLILRVAMRTYIALASATEDWSKCDSIQSEPFELICSCLELFSEDRIIQREGLRALVNAVCQRGSQTTFENMIRAIKNATRALTCVTVTDDRFSVEAALLVIGNASANFLESVPESEICDSKEERKSESKAADDGAYLDAAFHADVIHVIADMMTKFFSSQSVQIRAFQALANSFKMRVRSPAWDTQKVSKQILTIMRNFPDVAVLQRYGVMSIVNSLGSFRWSEKDGDEEAYRKLLVEHGALLTVKQAAWTFDLDPIIAKWSQVGISMLDQR